MYFEWKLKRSCIPDWKSSFFGIDYIKKPPADAGGFFNPRWNFELEQDFEISTLDDADA